MRSSWAALLVIALLASLGCDRVRPARPGAIARWEAQLGIRAKASRLSRDPADTGPRCLKDRVGDSKALRQEATRLERTFGGAPLSGDVFGRDLSTLAPAQAKYLSANEYWFAAEKIDPTRCEDLPCILNQIYGERASDEGWKIYYYFLSTGYSLSCRDFVPQTGSRWSESPASVEFKAPFAKFLWSDQELTSFVKLSYLLPSTYRNIGTQRFHRVPDVAKVPSPSWCPGNLVRSKGLCKSPSTICADSWGSRDRGMIRAKKCLEETNYTEGAFYPEDDTQLADNGIRGQFYLTMTHELTHAWDRSQAHGLTPQGFLAEFSDTYEWLQWSGWHVEPMVKKGRDGTRLDSFKWVTAPNAEHPVRLYGAGSPAEDLAEAAAWVRMRPESAAARIPKKAAFLSQKLYGGRTYDAAGLARYYEDAVIREIQPQLLEVLGHCRSNVGGAGTGAEVAGECLRAELNSRTVAALDGLRAIEWEACDFLLTQEVPLRNHAIARLEVEATRIGTLQVEAIQALRNELNVQIDAREAYRHCYKQADPEGCYDRELGTAFDLVAQPYAAKLGAALSEERSAFAAKQPFADAKENTNRFFQQLFAGVEPLVTTMAKKRWKSCLDATSSPATKEPLFAPFSGGAHFVAAEILTCIDRDFEMDLKAARDQYLGRLGLSVNDPTDSPMILEQLLPIYLDVLKTLEDAAAQEEDQVRERRRPAVIDVLISRLSGVELPRCIPAAVAAFDDYFKMVSPAEQLPVRFAALADIRTQWTTEACEKTSQRALPK